MARVKQRDKQSRQQGFKHEKTAVHFIDLVYVIASEETFNIFAYQKLKCDLSS